MKYNDIPSVDYLIESLDREVVLKSEKFNKQSRLNSINIIPDAGNSHFYGESRGESVWDYRPRSSYNPYSSESRGESNYGYSYTYRRTFGESRCGESNW